MMKNFKLTIAYDGTKYFGWQRQEGSTDKTIQGKIEQVLTKMMGHRIEIIGSGRTDAGVHARAQIANFSCNSEVTSKELQSYLNQYLPEDIAITNVEVVDERFHSRYNVKRKTYLYRIYTGDVHPIFERKYVYYLKESLDANKMEEASKLLLGTHDYKGFSTKSTKKSTIKTIYDIRLEKIENEIRLYITGNGFLYNMVRIITGTLIQIGSNKMSVLDIENILNQKDRSEAGVTAPAQGLVLYEVEY